MRFILGVEHQREDDGRPLSVSTFHELWSQSLLGMGLRLLLDKQNWILPRARYLEACAKLHTFVDFAIDQSIWRTENPSSVLNNNTSMVDVVVPQALNKNDARNQLMHTVLANQETTAVLTCNAIQLLAEHPSIWKQLREEVQIKGADLLTFDGLRESKLVYNILMETLRLRPVFAVFGRRTLRDVTLPAGGGPKGDQPLHVPAGTNGIANFWGLNFDPAVFGPDVHKFRPDRWKDINPSAKEFAPFGMGGRACLGKEKALVEASYVLFRLVERFEGLEGLVGGQWKPSAQLSMRNKAGYKVAFHAGKEE
jgi:cytochrome P450